MITKEEAKIRISRWNGDCSERIVRRPDGFEFVEVKLFYRDEEQPLDLTEIRTPKEAENPFRQVVVDTFIYPKQ